MFFDDTYLNYKARVSYSLFRIEDFNETAAFIKANRILITGRDLADYVLEPENYKYAIIARIKNSIVGIALFTDFESEVFINCLFVNPVHRFKGIGSNLLKELKAFMGQRAVTYLDTSNNYMPWMDALDVSNKAAMINQLGSFYKPGR
ncbi:putative acetyltransferase [Legionella quinlivanii]|uniref:Putative acetyltransferase n=1 Tax=Legionella quinlivanii TaxID=45073 RepID=A0A0W0Y655_9GAMM|nr:GNAT family N-acetyltransferase [Legionella quinlivanii]KTD52191.1 putative acetyltransferase [Legionella quinlivanii]SEF76132.1 Acetyltransferase (GNAT) domain-containing protein [Legionella quinlivanii DSM 21216]STY12310.1 Putative Acetyltransferases [Legionella quinlivanii]